MLPPEEIAKIFLLIPATIFLFYSAVYIILYELNIQPHMSKLYRNLSMVLAGGGAVLLVAFIII